MQDQPDLYFYEGHLEHPVEGREVFLSVIHDTQMIRYIPHAKLKEAEDNWRMFALAKLGVERDKMSPSDVEVIQKFLGVEHQP